MPGRLTEIMENSSENIEEQRLGTKKKEKRKCLPDDELKVLNDLSGFPHLATMLQAEEAVRQGNLVSREKLNSPETISVVNGNQLRTAVDVSKEGCVENTYELLQTDRDADTLEVIDLPSASPRQDVAVDYGNSQNIRELISHSSGDLNAEEQQEKSRPNEHDRSKYALLPLAEDVLPMKLLVDAGNKDTCKEMSGSSPIESKSAVTEENIVLRKLIRRWRYFDMEDENFRFEGLAVKSVAKNRKKPCYICGDAQHAGKKCRKRRTCHVCKVRGHLAEDCPKSSQEFDICLRCGESGHDLFSCKNEYSPDDLKNIVCYVCNEGGHICCCNYTNISPNTLSCYNCGESGHSGLQCPKSRMDKNSSCHPSICYKCGEEGHAARKCGVPVQNKHQQSKDCSTKSNGVSV